MGSLAYLFTTVDAPPTTLGRHRILSPSAGVRVSPLCLGGMNFGDSWSEFMGKCDKDTTFKILDYFYESGGNFIDTSNNYQNEESEQWIGEWMHQHKNRNEIVLATKFTTSYQAYVAKGRATASNYGGNSTKSMHNSIRSSLKNLRTDYIDLLYVHWWDFTTSVEELMQSLNQLVISGKVLYLGISDTPAWIVAKCNQYARDHGLRPFSVYQGKWSAALRDFERDILPMCEAEGMAIAPWGALGGGQFKTEEQRKQAVGRGAAPPSKVNQEVSQHLEKIAESKKTSITSVALAYVMHKAPYVFPIVGGRNIEHLKGNIEALNLELSAEDIEEIEKGYEFDPGFPMNFLMGPSHSHGTRDARDSFLTRSIVRLDMPSRVQPIRPSDMRDPKS